MDFLTYYQCVIDMDFEPRLTMSRTPQEALDDYKYLSFNLDVSVGKGEATSLRFEVDTGGITSFPLKYTDKLRLKKKKVKRPATGTCELYRLKETLKLNLGESSRLVKDPLAWNLPYVLLSERELRKTTINP